MDLNSKDTRPCKRLPRVQSCPAQLATFENEQRVRPRDRDSAFPPVEQDKSRAKMPRTAYSMSNMAAADTPEPDGFPNASSRMYCVVAKRNGASMKFNFSPTDTIQSMIDTMGKSTLRSSSSCLSIGEEQSYNGGGLEFIMPTSQAAPQTDAMAQLVLAINNTEVSLTEDSLGALLDSNIQIVEPVGTHSGLADCVSFLHKIFEANDRPYVVVKEEPNATNSQEMRSGTMMADVTFSPVTVECKIAWSTMKNALTQIHFLQNPREICGYENVENALTIAAGESPADPLEDLWNFNPSFRFSDGELENVDKLWAATSSALDQENMEQENMELPMSSALRFNNTSTEQSSHQPLAQVAPMPVADPAMSIPAQPGATSMLALPAVPQQRTLAFDSVPPAVSQASQSAASQAPVVQDIPSLREIQAQMETFGGLEDILSGNIDDLIQEDSIFQNQQHVKKSAKQVRVKSEVAVSAPAQQQDLKIQPVVHREGYMRSKAHEARGVEQDYVCGYCGHSRTSASACSDGRVRIRCACGGKHKDGKPRMHANWRPLNGVVVKPQESVDLLDSVSANNTSLVRSSSDSINLGGSMSGLSIKAETQVETHTSQRHTA